MAKWGLWVLAVFSLFEYHQVLYEDSLPAPCQLISSACQTPPKLPFPRTEHTAIMYTTWTQADANMLCTNSKCGPLCLESSVNCTTQTKRFVPAPEGETTAIGSVKDSFCPETCCATENCRRVRDALGELVPFEEEVMLVFGGKAFRNVSVYGTMLYNNCTSER